MVHKLWASGVCCSLDLDGGACIVWEVDLCAKEEVKFIALVSELGLDRNRGLDTPVLLGCWLENAPPHSAVRERFTFSTESLCYMPAMRQTLYEMLTKTSGMCVLPTLRLCIGMPGYRQQLAQEISLGLKSESQECQPRL